jgi:hypothetical protein
MRHEGSIRRSRAGRWLAPVLGLVLLTAACSSSGKTSSSSGASGSSGSGSASSDAALGTPHPATGTPVKLGYITASESASLSAQFQRQDEGVKAAVSYTNDYLGGIGGHKIELDTCQGGETPAGSQTCANQMVNDHHKGGDPVHLPVGRLDRRAHFARRLRAHRRLPGHVGCVRATRQGQRAEEVRARRH